MHTHTQTITPDSLLALLRGFKGAVMVTIETNTLPSDLRKTGNPFYDADTKVFSISKWSNLNGVLGFNYENSVNKQRTREGNEEEFEAQPRKWGQRIQGTCLVEHKGEFYAELKVQDCLAREYRDHDGNPVDLALLKPFIPEKKEGARQEVENAVILRDIKLASIVAIRVGQVRYEVERVAAG